jgi:acyl-CoA synthetase (AMP-forming)/AMP-acid ligase II
MVQPVSLDVADFRSKIAEVLPVHALPGHITAVDNFPMTSAGKLDYRAVPTMSGHL